MKFLIIQHVEFEGPGTLLNWILSHGHTASFCKPYQGDTIPTKADVDGLVVLGGPMSVYDSYKFPWLKKEVALISAAINGGKKVLGICLGAQLIAHSLRSSIFKNQYSEIGWFPVDLNQAEFAKHLKIKVPRSINALHWHSEAFALPFEAISLGTSEATKCQAYLYNTNVMGLLCHFEMNAASVQNMLDYCQGDLVSVGKYIQTPQQIASGLSYAKETEFFFNGVLNAFF